MSLVSLRQLLDHAGEYGYGFPAFNVNNLEQIQSVMEAAHETDSPVIIQFSRGACKYAGEVFTHYLMKATVETYPHIPVCFHQDHGNSLSTCGSAIRNNFSSVMMDGSLQADGKTPSDYAYNMQVTKEVTDLAHPLGVSVEGELGNLGSLETGKGEKEDGHGFDGTLDKDQLLTNPKEAVQFVKDTHVDALAVAIGTSHGAYKFTRKPDGQILAMEVIKEINKLIPTLHMVMHGSSSVPQELQDIINKYGGKMPQTFGVPIEEIQLGIKHGVRKVNVDTDCRMAIAGQIRKILVEKPDEFDPRKILAPARDKMKEVCKIRYEAFGTAGHASKIKPISLVKMSERYLAGELKHSFKI